MQMVWFLLFILVLLNLVDCGIQVTIEPLQEAQKETPSKQESQTDASSQADSQENGNKQETTKDNQQQEPVKTEKKSEQHSTETNKDRNEVQTQEPHQEQDSTKTEPEPQTELNEPTVDAGEKRVEPTQPDATLDGNIPEETTPEPDLLEKSVPEEPIPEGPDQKETIPEPSPEKWVYCVAGFQRECPLMGTGDCGIGVQTCSAQNRWDICGSPGSSTPEVCDGRDNNCDGQIDETFPKTTCCVPTTELFHSQRTQQGTAQPSVAISPDGKEMAIIDQQSVRLEIIEPKTGKNIRNVSTKQWFSRIPRPIVYHPTKHWIAVGGKGNTATQDAVFLFDAKASKLIRTFQGRSMDPKNQGSTTRSEATKVRFSPDGSLLTALFDDSAQSSKTTSRKQVVVWRTDTGSIVQTINAQQIMLSDVAFSHDNKLMATGTIVDQIKLWRLSDGALLYTLEPTFKKMSPTPPNHMSMDFHPKQDKLLVISPNAEIRVWNTKTGKLEKQLTFPGASMTQINLQIRFFAKYDRQGLWFLVAPYAPTSFSAGLAKGFYLIDSKSYKTLHTFGYNQTTYNFHGLHWSTDNKTFTVIESINAWRFGCTR